MTVKLALLITSEGFALAHRQPAGHWAILGDVAFSTRKLDRAVGKLRKVAVAREGEDFSTLLVLPDDQILYTSLTAPTGDDEVTALRIEEGLEGLTPYAVSELVYDWRAVDTDRVKLAVVARETLDEARAFAESHKLNPAGFAATPPEERFPGVPLFDVASDESDLGVSDDGIAFGPDDWSDEPEAEADAPAAETPETQDADAADAEAADASPVADDSATAAAPQTDTSADTNEADADPDAKADDTAPMPAGDAEDAADAEASDTAAAEVAQAAEAEAVQPYTAASPDPDLPEAADLDPEEAMAGVGTPAAAEIEPEPVFEPDPIPERKSAVWTDAAEAPRPDDPQPVLEDRALTDPIAPLHDSRDDDGGGFADDDIPPLPSAAILAARNASKSMRDTSAPEFSSRGDRVPARDEDDADRSAPAAAPAPELPGSAADDAPPAGNTLAERLSRVRDASRTRPRDGEGTGTPRPVTPPGRGKPAAPPPRKGRLSGLTAAPRDAGADMPDTTESGLSGRLGGFLRRTPRADGRPESGAATAPIPGRDVPATGRLSALGAALRGQDSAVSPAGTPPVTLIGDDKATTDETLTGGLLGRAPEDSSGATFRTGLLLTIVLLVVLAAIAVWSALFLPDSPVARLFGGGSEARVEDPLDAPAPPVAITAPPAIGDLAPSGAPPASLPAGTDDEIVPPADVDIADEAAADGVEQAAPIPDGPLPQALAADDAAATGDPVAEAVAEAVADAVTETAPAEAMTGGTPTELADTIETAAAPPVPPLPPLPVENLPTLEETQSTYDQFGIWPRPPDRPDVAPLDSLSDLGLSASDTTVAAIDAFALPTPAIDPGETLRRVPPPPPFGSQPETTSAGLVAPTADGVLTPDGVLVTAGPPPVRAVPRPQEVALPAPPPSFDIEDAILGTFRPAPRPDEFGQAAGPAAPLAPPATRQASLAPQPRSPPDPAAADPAPTSATSAASAASLASLAPAATDAIDTDASGAAVARSLVPSTRPGNIDALIARADRAQPEAVIEAAAIAPGPSIPSNADVARAATQRNELRLRDVNLIGVTGTNSDRRALVRLPSGRFVRVAVGDRLDGGRVAAIGETTLQYVRSGRTITLDIPG